MNTNSIGRSRTLRRFLSETQTQRQKVTESLLDQLPTYYVHIQTLSSRLHYWIGENVDLEAENCSIVPWPQFCKIPITSDCVKLVDNLLILNPEISASHQGKSVCIDQLDLSRLKIVSEYQENRKNLENLYFGYVEDARKTVSLIFPEGANNFGNSENSNSLPEESPETSRRRRLSISESVSNDGVISVKH